MKRHEVNTGMFVELSDYGVAGHVVAIREVPRPHSRTSPCTYVEVRCHESGEIVTGELRYAFEVPNPREAAEQRDAINRAWTDRERELRYWLARGFRDDDIAEAEAVQPQCVPYLGWLVNGKAG